MTLVIFSNLTDPMTLWFHAWAKPIAEHPGCAAAFVKIPSAKSLRSPGFLETRCHGILLQADHSLQDVFGF